MLPLVRCVPTVMARCDWLGWKLTHDEFVIDRGV